MQITMKARRTYYTHTHTHTLTRRCIERLDSQLWGGSLLITHYSFVSLKPRVTSHESRRVAVGTRRAPGLNSPLSTVEYRVARQAEHR